MVVRLFSADTGRREKAGVKTSIHMREEHIIDIVRKFFLFVTGTTIPT
jgi:hypothetical protein